MESWTLCEVPEEIFQVLFRNSHWFPSLLFCTVAILLKDDYFVSGAGLPGRFKAEKVEFHWGHSNGSAGSEHSINGRRFPVEVRASPASERSCALDLALMRCSVVTPSHFVNQNVPTFAPGNFLWTACQVDIHSQVSHLCFNWRSNRSHTCVGLSRLTPGRWFSTICFIWHSFFSLSFSETLFSKGGIQYVTRVSSFLTFTKEKSQLINEE